MATVSPSWAYTLQLPHDPLAAELLANALRELGVSRGGKLLWAECGGSLN
ncbi:hypothetical protein KUF83_01950 [Streptomyces sp. BV286]|nr:hypothetical protein [Streptomyces sp. BV286]MBV1935326.1 hypothetical protein [Streptomyces sp. BV286]